MSRKKKTTLRIEPENWLDPYDFKDAFPHPKRPLEVDIGSGKGRFLVARSNKFSEVNYLGIERQLIRINSSGRRCERAGCENVRLFRMEGYYAISRMMPPNYVANYYFFFPDPWPKARHHDYRLFNPAFMDALFRTLEEGGCLHVATDHLPYFEEIHGLLRRDPRFDEIAAFQPDEEERTDFELVFSHKQIGRCSFRKI
ncbi:MAG: tRNA (guanosine(46)-N7)-methyltransferase TrmB [Kiritimatiellales bacterium]|nr:tRNA (guanosine(46)-N7)-methyltransferase TrmB [Kiritimatiellales bacterium]MCF7864466.1 tRNA (guanosine(46)-N7)-methyltransferase TrmB [Kiritimatiellales bacterium]